MESLIKHVEVKEIKKGELFVKAGRTNDYDYFLLNGICRSYLVNQNNEDITISFFQDKTVITPNIARTHHNKSTVTIEALTDVEIGRFRAIELVHLMREIPEMRSFANAVLQHELTLKSNKELFNATFTAKERLLEFRKQFNALENIIPHPIIASYLGITNISLSRLRNELAKE